MEQLLSFYFAAGYGQRTNIGNALVVDVVKAAEERSIASSAFNLFNSGRVSVCGNVFSQEQFEVAAEEQFSLEVRIEVG